MINVAERWSTVRVYLGFSLDEGFSVFSKDFAIHLTTCIYRSVDL